MQRSSDPVHVLVVDDEREVREVLRQGLEAEGFIVYEAADRATMLAAMEAEPIDLITLDLMLGREDGADLAREARAKRNLPIIMITGRGEANDRIAGLELGVDDYIAKPFYMREVALRIRRVVSRYRPVERVPAARR